MAAPSYQQPVDCEKLDDYRPGGFHPIHLGDTFKDGRYIVLHKLGYGSSATVWLIKDTLTDTYASLKVLTAEATASSQELKVLLHLEESEGVGKEYVIQLSDHFQHEGPNGTHQCIVTELMGLSLITDIEDVYPNEAFPPSVAKRFIAQVTLGLSYLHSRNVAHGDLHLGNLLLYSDGLTPLLHKEGFEAVYGPPEKYPLYLQLDKWNSAPAPPSPHAPDYRIVIPEPESLLHLGLDDPTRTQIKIADFSESYILDVTTEPRPLHAPLMYRPPEGLIASILKSPVYSSLATDIWNLAVLFHVLFSGGDGLFRSYHRAEYTLLQIVAQLGPFPEPLWSTWPNRHKYFDDQGTWIHAGDAPIEIFVLLYDSVMCAEEKSLFAALLRGMVDYDSERRLKIDDVTSSEWFTRYCVNHIR